MLDPDALTEERRRDPRLVAAFAAIVVLLLVLLLRSLDPFGWFGDPAPEEVPVGAAAGDVTLLEIREAADLQVATGRFSVPVIVDAPPRSGLRERLPEFVDGERIVAIYQGDVNATIDLRGLGAEGVTADPVARTITLRVPEPRLSSPAIDHEKSQIVSHTRGIVQRLEDAAGEGVLLVKEDLDREAVSAIAQAAEDSNLRETGRTNGRHFLTALCQRLGYEQVTIEFVAPPG
ncbi:MAG: DUF4230 domain-containing protein [Propionibacteriaceae bacterium]|nr:DUF4230 domain-containing protein [Propionibacteriaceae bacterium]